MRHKMVSLSLFLALFWLIAGCGGGSEEPKSDPKTTQQPQAMSQQSAELKGDAERGKTLFVQSCSACHGPDGKGLPGLGKNLVTSQFVKEKTDMELLDYVKKGRAVDDPLNTTGIPMPPKGGNPALSDQNIMDIIAYIRTIEQ
ncbi:MAG: cytochrome c [Calditrichaeota bacterium]|nr:MAG: cytochrome c [Calditrichota bacterium]